MRGYFRFQSAQSRRRCGYFQFQRAQSRRRCGLVQFQRVAGGSYFKERRLTVIIEDQQRAKENKKLRQTFMQI